MPGMTNTRLGLIAVWILLGSLVIFSPKLFSVKDDLITESPRHEKLVALHNKFSRNGIKDGIAHADLDIARGRAELDELNAKKPWTGQTPHRLKMQIVDATDKLSYAQQQRHSLVEAKDNMLTQIRSLTPVFSDLAWEETRDLFYARQESHAGMSARMWKWDMMFDMMFGGMSRDDNPMVYILTAIVKLFMRLTLGSVMALVDFAIRLPFWIKEYQLFTSDDLESMGHHQADQGTCGDNPDQEACQEGENYEQGYEENLKETRVGEGYQSEARGRAVGGGGGWASTAAATLFWILAMFGATLATALLILAIWSPLILLGAFAFWKAKQEQAQRGGRAYPQQPQQRLHQD